MGLNFRKRVKILPGITLNFSKSGVSTSVGTRGANMTFGHGKTRTTVGLPGTGISHTSVVKNKIVSSTAHAAQTARPIAKSGAEKWALLFAAAVIVGMILVNLQ